MINARYGIYIALSFLLIFLGMGFVNSIRLQTSLDRYIEEYNAFKKSAEITVLYADSLESKISDYIRQVDSLEANLQESEQEYLNSSNRVRLLEQERVALKAQVTDSILEVTPPEVLEYVGVLEEENTELRISIDLLEEISINKSQQISTLAIALDLQTLRADSLYTIVQNIPDAPKNNERLFGIKKPSRLSSFIIGAITASVIILSN
jgi:vacuolar-type H+-ATPase subunit I/STV1